MLHENKTIDLLSVASIPLVMTLGNSMLIPVLPLIEKKLSISAFQSSLMITVYSIAAIILIPIAGFLSDRVGRKTIIIPSLIISGLGGLISGWAAWKMSNPYWMILVGRLLQGVGAAGAFPIVLPLVGDMFTHKKQISNGLGIVETSNTLGKVLSPILGAYLATIVWFLPFFSFPVFCLISILLIWFLVQTPKKKDEPQKLSLFFSMIRKTFHKDGRWILAIFFVGGLCMFILFGILFYLSSLLEDKYGITGIRKGLILAIPLAALCISSYIAGKVIGEDMSRMKWLTFWGILIIAASSFIVSFTESLIFLIAVIFTSGLGIGGALPSLDSLITSGFEKSERGTISSIYSSMRFVGVALGPPVFAIFKDQSHKVLFFSVAGISLLTAIIALVFIKPPKKDKGLSYWRGE
ncbi:MFS transporter [Bacillus horti]|uniref:ACDE family multidrug resistance protein n=1 Tax=Caldalkalibacillus horti TaxID=77523 RepID=A0ABT9VY82_9BACI|nr:MFS transporter [Bacillus horti]MDQ0165929.1 ACDE family multidrug resistance protein [Bacillus horti]